MFLRGSLWLLQATIWWNSFFSLTIVTTVLFSTGSNSRVLVYIPCSAFAPDGPAKPRCIQTECTSANTNHHSVTDLSHLLVIVLDETSSVQPDNYSNHALHKTMTRKYPHVLPAEHQTRLLRSHPALAACTDVAFTGLRWRPKTAQLYHPRWRIKIYFTQNTGHAKKILIKRTFSEGSQRLR